MQNCKKNSSSMFFFFFTFGQVQLFAPILLFFLLTQITPHSSLSDWFVNTYNVHIHHFFPTQHVYCNFLLCKLQIVNFLFHKLQIVFFYSALTYWENGSENFQPLQYMDNNCFTVHFITVNIYFWPESPRPFLSARNPALR